MQKNTCLNNFSGGEWSSFLDGRADLAKYETACLSLKNFRPLPWGGATYRSGTLLAGLAKDTATPVRLIPFNYSTSLSYVLELGNLYMRFWYSNGTPVLSGGLPYEIVTPWTTAQLFGIQLKQINAQVRMTHPSVTPQTLTYTSATSWAISGTAWKYPPLLNQNATQANVLNVAAVTGATTLTSSLAQFNASHVGSYWELQHLRPSTSALLDLNNQTIGVKVYSTALTIQGDWTFSTSQFWWGQVQVERSVDGGTTWVVIRDFTAKSDQNYSTSGTESAPNIGDPSVQYRIAYTKTGTPFDAAIWTGAAPTSYAFAQASLEAQDAYIAGLVLVTGFVSSTVLNVTVIISPYSIGTTYLWSEGAFSTYRGFPQCIAFYEQRLLYSGTSYNPNTIWGSVTGDFDNFQYSSNDDAAVAFQPAVCQQNQAAWLATLLRIHLGTSGEEIIMASGNLDEALTPSNVTMRAQSYYGSTPIQPILLQNSVIFVERNGLRVREMRELSPYVVPTDFVAPDLTLLAEHITQPGLVEMDFGRLPDPLAYFIRSDGVMAVCTYNREQNINAWAQYNTSGSYESVACIYGAPADEIWVSVKRHLNGSDVRCIEVFTTDPAQYPNIVTNMMLDCGTQFLQGILNPTTNTTLFIGANPGGIYWLRNTTVTMVVDGAEYAGLTCDSSGVVPMPAGVVLTANSVVNIGLPYVGYLTPMKPELVDQEGSSQGRQRRVTEVVVRVRNSRNVDWAGGADPATSDWKPLQFRAPNDTTGDATGLVAGVSDIPLPGPWPDGFNYTGQVNLRQTRPCPLTILAVSVKFDVT